MNTKNYKKISSKQARKIVKLKNPPIIQAVWKSDPHCWEDINKDWFDEDLTLDEEYTFRVEKAFTFKNPNKRVIRAWVVYRIPIAYSTKTYTKVFSTRAEARFHKNLNGGKLIGLDLEVDKD